MKYVIIFNAVSLPGKAAFKGEIIDESEIASGEVDNLLAMGAIREIDLTPGAIVVEEGLTITKLDSMTKKDLLIVAGNLGLTVSRNLSNDKIIALIQKELAQRNDNDIQDSEEDLPNTEDLEDVDED